MFDCPSVNFGKNQTEHAFLTSSVSCASCDCQTGQRKFSFFAGSPLYPGMPYGGPGVVSHKRHSRHHHHHPHAPVPNTMDESPYPPHNQHVHQHASTHKAVAVANPVQGRTATTQSYTATSSAAEDAAVYEVR